MEHGTVTGAAVAAETVGPLLRNTATIGGLSVIDPIDPYLDPLLEVINGPARITLPSPSSDTFRCDECGRHVESGLLLVDHIVWEHA